MTSEYKFFPSREREKQLEGTKLIDLNHGVVDLFAVFRECIAIWLGYWLGVSSSEGDDGCVVMDIS